MTKRILYLIRHGQYEPLDDPNGTLTEVGKEQAYFTAKRFQECPISTIYFSTMPRAKETAVIIANQFPNAKQIASPLLRECFPSVPEPFKAHFAQFPAEEITAGKVQAHKAFESYFNPIEDGDDEVHEMIVAHGNLISHFICQILQAPVDSWIRTDIFHCGISQIIIFSNGLQKLIRHNDNSHLPPHLQTEN